MIYDKNNPNKILACAKLYTLRAREVRSYLDMDGVKGQLRFSQRHPFDPTLVTIKMDNLAGRGKFFHVHQYPFRPPIDRSDQPCSAMSAGFHFNPFKVDFSRSPPAGQGTGDEYELGDLSGKYGTLSSIEKGHFSAHLDLRLPLFGVNSISGRSLVVHKVNGDRWICAPIGYPGPTITARAVFYYPVVGEAVFRQLQDNPISETTVHIRLSYSDGTLNTTTNHAWNVHEKFAGRDFFNWSRRCESTGPQFDPVHVSSTKYSSRYD